MGSNRRCNRFSVVATSTVLCVSVAHRGEDSTMRVMVREVGIEAILTSYCLCTTIELQERQEAVAFCMFPP